MLIFFNILGLTRIASVTDCICGPDLSMPARPKVNRQYVGFPIDLPVEEKEEREEEEEEGKEEMDFNKNDKGYDRLE